VCPFLAITPSHHAYFLRPPRKKSADLGSSRCEVDIKRVYDAVIRPGNLSNAGLILPTCRLFRLSLELKKFATRQLEEECPYLILDARYEKVREDG